MKNELYERSKKTAHEPTRKTTTYSCSSDSASKAAASGIDASSAARRMSATTMTRRLTGRASTQTPTGSANTRCGSQKSAVSSPISVALACSISTAASGIASALIWSPKTETETEAQSRTEGTLAAERRHRPLEDRVCARHYARKIRMSPLIDVARSSTSGAPAAGRSSRTSSSDVASPLIVRTSR